LIAAADSKGSVRSRQTLTPLRQALKMPLHMEFKDKDFQGQANDLKSHWRGQRILICWHHGGIPGLVHALGADPVALIPSGKWPPEVFGWMIELRYNHAGQLMAEQCKRINEHLMPDDSLLPAK
jgi:hypothetical protein